MVSLDRFLRASLGFGVVVSCLELMRRTLRLAILPVRDPSRLSASAELGAVSPLRSSCFLNWVSLVVCSHWRP